MDYYGKYINQLIEEFGKLPGIGAKTARRLAFHVIHQSERDAKRFAETIVNAKEKTTYCQRCYTLTDDALCPICKSVKRDDQRIMVVEDSKDLVAYERTKQYKGLYHVLHGTMSPMLGMGPDDLKIKELMTRLGQEPIEEIILATSSTVEGEATAVYISKLLHNFDVRVTRIANGVPVGGDLEYVDEVTLSRALDGRVEM